MTSAGSATRRAPQRRIAMISAHTSPLAPLGGPQSGGMNVYVLELSRELGARGYAVDVYTRWASPASPEVQPIGPNARVIHIEAGPREAIEKGAISDTLDAFYENLLAFAERDGATYDLVHSHYWMSGLVGVRLAARWRAPHIVMFHTLAEMKMRANSEEQEPPVRIAAERAIAGLADRIVVATRDEAQALTELYGASPEAIDVVPCGVDLDLFTPMDKEAARRRLGLRDGERIILFVGRIEPLKGIDILINAAVQLHDDENFRVLIVGGDARAEAEIAQLKELAASLDVDHHISFVGAVEHDQLPMYYNAADVCVMPSHYESFGLVAVESMACGTPVVATRVGGLATTISDGETGYLIPWRRPGAFAERLELLLDNDELRASLGRAAREAVQRFRWANVGDAVSRMYESLEAGASGGANGAQGQPGQIE